MLSGSSNIYRDAQGRFTVAVPAGWTPNPQGENGSQGVTISSGSNWVMLGPYGGGAKQPSDVVVGLANQFQSQYKNFTIVTHGPVQLNGHPGESAIFKGTNARGVEVSLVITGVAASGGHYLAMIASSPASEAATAMSVFGTIFNSIRFEGEQQ